MLKFRIVRALIMFFCLCLVVMVVSEAYAVKANMGVRGCGGTHFQRTAQNETHRTFYTLRNFNLNESIVITKVLVIGADGSLLFNGIPTISTFKTIIGPAQNTKFNTGDVLSSYLSDTERPIQLYVVWYTASGNPAEGLRGGGSHLVRDSTTGNEISRGSGGCTDLDLF